MKKIEFAGANGLKASQWSWVPECSSGLLMFFNNIFHTENNAKKISENGLGVEGEGAFWCESVCQRLSSAYWRPSHSHGSRVRWLWFGSVVKEFHKVTCKPCHFFIDLKNILVVEAAKLLLLVAPIQSSHFIFEVFWIILVLSTSITPPMFHVWQTWHYKFDFILQS